MIDEVRIEYMPLVELAGRFWEANPKEHNVGDLTLSLERFGFVNPVIVNEADGRLLAGHGRVKTLLALKHEGRRPDRIAERDGDWLVPVVRGVRLEADDAPAYAIADNQLTVGSSYALAEMWDLEALAGVLQELQAGDGLEGTGFDEDGLQKLLTELANQQEAKEETFDVGAALEAQVEPRIKRGEMWRLGKHRLMCGDSTSAEDVAKLMAGEGCSLVATDPPYGVGYESRGKEKRSILNDDNADWGAAWVLWCPPVIYQWHSALFGDIAKASLEREGYDVRQQIVWVKPSFVLGRQAYHWQHESCWYAVKKGAVLKWLGDRTQSTVWEFPSPLAGGHSRDAQVTSHPTQKPLGVFEIPIRNHCESEDIVADPFLGSGTAMIAAERLGRICLGMELDPKWAEVAIQRWEDYTGQKAERIDA